MHRHPYFPDYVYVELTNICNAKCTICATPTMQRSRGIMSMALFRKIVDECGRYKPKKILPFLHGESLLVPNVVDYFRYIRKVAPGVHVNLTTNGSQLSGALTDIFLKENLLDSVVVSIDGGNKKTFEKIRLGLNYERVRENVLYFIKRRNQLGKSSPKVTISMVTVNENKHTRKKLKKVWKEADEVNFSVYFNWAGKLESHRKIHNKINYCERLYHYITILVDGRVGMCCFDSEGKHSVGHVNEQSIYEIWHSDQFNQKRKWLYEKQFNRLALCARCDYINHPAWTTHLVRLRPYAREFFPRLTTTVENIYKGWLMR